MIKQNVHKYSVSAMCKVLNIPRSTYYYESQQRIEDSITEDIVEIFHESDSNYGTRKIKKELVKRNIIASRRRIGRIMKSNGLVSSYAIAQFKPHKTTCNEDDVKNELARNFDNNEPLAAVVSDLTYVRVGNRWNYICILIDLFNREIIGYSAGERKDAQLVHRAFASFNGNLGNIKLFHTDRGNEFKNQLIDEVLNTFNINRSLSMKGCPYDNAVAEATFKIFKTEFVKRKRFDSLYELQTRLTKYINWFNNKRIHGTLGYLSPVEYKMQSLY